MIAVAAVAVPPGPVPETKVNYRTSGKTAKAILAEMSAASGVPLTTTNATEDEILALRLKDVPLSEAMKKIAWAANADWKPHEGGFQLVREAATAKAEAKREFDALTRTVRDSIAEQAKPLFQTPTFGEPEAEKLATDLAQFFKSMNPDSIQSAAEIFAKYKPAVPLGRMLARILTTLDPADLASTPLGLRVVYALDPHPTQRPLSSTATLAVEQYFDEQAAWAVAAKRHGIANPTKNGTTFAFDDITGHLEPIDRTTVGRVFVSVLRSNMESKGVLVDLKILDKQGHEVASANTTLGFDFQNVLHDVIRPPAGGKAFDTPAEARQALDFIKSRGHPRPGYEAVQAKFAQPEKYEPLSLGAGAMFLASADALDLPMVVDLHDSSLEMYSKDREKFVPEQFLKGALYSDFEQEASSNWIAFRPSQATFEREHRASRTAVRDFLRKSAGFTPSSLEAQAEATLQLPRSCENLLAGAIRRALTNGDAFDDRIFRFYGHMSPELRQQCARGSVRLVDLPDHCLEDLRYLVFGGEPSFLAYSHDGQAVRPVEATESLPNALPPQGILHANISNAAIVQMENEGEIAGISWPKNLDAIMLGYLRFVRSRPELFPPSGEDHSGYLSHLRFGSREKIDFRFDLGVELNLIAEIHGIDLSDAQVYTLDTLPEAFRKEVQKQFEDSKKWYANEKPGDPGLPRTIQGGSPPP